MSFQDQLHATRAEQRKQRLLEAERELAAEEAEALKMTEEQRQTLLQSFKSVKAEFADLDGLRWTQTALRKFQPPQRRAIHVSGSGFSSPASSSVANNNHNTYVVLTNVDLGSFSGDDTIRPAGHAHPRPPLMCRSSVHPPKVKPSKRTIPNSQQNPFEHSAYKHRDGRRTRSPVKGLFAAPDANEADRRAEAVNVPPTDDISQRHGQAGGIPSTSAGRGQMGMEVEVVHGSGPPGLSPAPTYAYAASQPPGETGTVANGAADISSSSSSTTGNPPVLQSHRDAPSPPTPLHASVPYKKSLLSSSPITIDDSLLAPPASSPDLLSAPARQRHSHGHSHIHGQNHEHNHHNAQGTLHAQRSPRARLHSLLRDEPRLAFPGLPPLPASKPLAFPGPPPLVAGKPSLTVAGHTATAPLLCPPMKPRIDLSGVRFAVDNDYDDDDDDDAEMYGVECDPFEDDDRTPMPSPTLDHGELDSSGGGGGAAWAAEREWRAPWVVSFSS